MSERRYLSAPVHLTGKLYPGQLSGLVALDVLRRGRGEQDAPWNVVTLAGGLAGQYALERELLREGHDRASLGRDQFADRTAEAESRWVQGLEELFVGLNLDVALPSEQDVAQLERAARVAFVRLYESGLLERTQQVVVACPRCETVVDDAESDLFETNAQEWDLTIIPDELVVRSTALELLLGTVAIAVPVGHTLIGSEVDLPVSERRVPVVVGEVDQPVLLVPGHDATAQEPARRAGQQPIRVFDLEGNVIIAGPFVGLARYAARDAMRERLEGAGLLADAGTTTENVLRCRRCATALIPRLGTHWFLDISDAKVKVTDAVREGAVQFASADARDIFLGGTQGSDRWCLSHQLWSGLQVPVASCIDCGAKAVACELPGSCGSCMGTLVEDDGVLDTRFVGAVWPLALAGWPDKTREMDDQDEWILSAGRGGVVVWGLAMAALGSQLTGRIPFDRVLLNEDKGSPATPVAITEFVGAVDEYGAATVRTAALVGQFDFVWAAGVVSALTTPAQGSLDVGGLTSAWNQAMEAELPAEAAQTLVAAVEGGVDESALSSVSALRKAMLGS